MTTPPNQDGAGGRGRHDVVPEGTSRSEGSSGSRLRGEWLVGLVAARFLVRHLGVAD